MHADQKKKICLHNKKKIMMLGNSTNKIFSLFFNFLLVLNVNFLSTCKKKQVILVLNVLSTQNKYYLKIL